MQTKWKAQEERKWEELKKMEGRGDEYNSKL